MNPGFKISEEFLKRMANLLGDEYSSFVQFYRQPAETGLRVNSLKVASHDFLKFWPITLQPLPWCQSGFSFVDNDTEAFLLPGKHPYHAAGLYYLQDPSAMAAAEILAPKPGEKVLDIAAAPGGKATHLAALMQNEGLFVANEIHPKRVWSLAENLERCGVRNAAVLQETPQRLAAHFGAFFDRVLLDAPCSGEGMFRKSHEARRDWSTKLIQSCAVRQKAILSSAAQLVRPGGFLLYSTCTFAPEENETVINDFLNQCQSDGLKFDLADIKRLPGFSSGHPEWILSSEKRYESLRKTVRLWPHHQAPEGHFIALLQRLGKSSNEKVKLFPNDTKSPSVHYFRQFCQENLTEEFPLKRLSIQGRYLYLTPEGLPDLKGLKVIHPGWWVGVEQKNRIEPTHAFALGLKANQVQRILQYQWDSPQVQAYLQGESLVLEGSDGWTLFTIWVDEIKMSFPLGWGKHSQGRLKNLYPRGLRWL